ncbi:hypothetical protein D3C86_1827930 [compost metagenome]
MKRVKFLLVFVFLLVGTLTVLAVTSNKYRKSALILQCLIYQGPQPISSSDIIDSGYWNPIPLNPAGNYCRGGETLCGICYDTNNTTADQARDAVYDYYVDNGLFPSHGVTILGNNGKMVTVYLKQLPN